MRNNFKFKNFKKALVLSSMLIMATGCNNVKESVPASTDSIVSLSIPEPSPTYSVERATPEERDNYLKSKVVDYIRRNYYKDINPDDIGCAIQTAIYLYDVDGTLHYDVDSYYRRENGEEVLNSDQDAEMYVFTDNTNDKRPIAGIIKKDDKISNLVVDSVHLRDEYVMKRDENKYVNFKGSPEDMKDYFEGANAYYQERKGKVR